MMKKAQSILIPVEKNTGPIVRIVDDLKYYTGMEAVKVIRGEARQASYKANYEQLRLNYSGAVEFQLRQKLVVLCDQTAQLLYRGFTPLRMRYRHGSRPVLEKAVRKIITGFHGPRENALSLMRFCRDLYKKNASGEEKEIYGGTEEQLIDKGEWTCECLGRLFVALCGIAGIPGRIVMHVIGGHITSEVYVEGGWAYVDPRVGMYFLKPDGALASTWELMKNPILVTNQPEHVKQDVGAQWTWEERSWKCEHMYFHPSEVNGFENYSLEDTYRYDYSQTAGAKARKAGMFIVHEEYLRSIREVFGLTEDSDRLSWHARKLENLPLIFRNDGFTLFSDQKPPMSQDDLEEANIDLFSDTNVAVLEWGLGPGSVFCFDTKIGDVFGEPLSDDQWKQMRKLDSRVYENVKSLIASGSDPLEVAVKRGHELGLKVYARLEMNHEYGPALEKNWTWTGLVGDLNKNNPHYRIPGSVNLDFKHQEVRDFKLNILREAAQKGCDGLSMDFVVYPPHFENPDHQIMTAFIREIREMADAVGEAQNRRIELIVRVPFDDAFELGLDWKTWMKEGLIDIIVPGIVIPGRYFDLNIDEFISMRNRTRCKVFGCSWQALGYAGTDPHPEDERFRKYDKPKTREMYFAQALLLHRSGVDGIQLARGETREWRERPWLNELGNPRLVEFADKQYTVDTEPYLPVSFARTREGAVRQVEKFVNLRIADDLKEAKSAGLSAEVTIILYCRRMYESETLTIVVNDTGTVAYTGAGKPAKDDDEHDEPVGSEDREKASFLFDESGKRDNSFLFDAEWWKRGEKSLVVEPEWLRMGVNSLRLSYTNRNAEVPQELSIVWIDILIRYRRVGRNNIKHKHHKQRNIL